MKKTKKAPIKIVNRQDLQDILKEIPGKNYIKIIKYIEQEVNDQLRLVAKNFEKQYEEIYQALDRNITAAFILNTDLSTKELSNIFKLSRELSKEDSKKGKKLKEGDEVMKKAEKYIDDLNYMIEKTYKDGQGKKESIVLLQSEFPQLSKSMIANAYKKRIELLKEGEELKAKAKEIAEEVSEDPDVIEAYNKIFGDEDEIKVTPKKTENKLEKKVEVEVKKVKEVEVREESKIKVINSVLEFEIQGELGIYKTENNKVFIDEVIYNSLEEVEEAYREQLEYLEKSRKELVDVYNFINKKMERS